MFRLHWHIAGIPPGVPYERQQFHALMTENGVLALSSRQRAETAGRIRTALAEVAGAVGAAEATADESDSESAS